MLAGWRSNALETRTRRTQAALVLAWSVEAPRDSTRGIRRAFCDGEEENAPGTDGRSRLGKADGQPDATAASFSYREIARSMTRAKWH